MSDTDQGQESSLFQEAVADLDKFENPELPLPLPVNDNQPAANDNKTTEKPAEPQLDAAVPSGRFREESEARRRAEREAQDLRAQLAAYQVQQPRQQQQPQQQKVDIFDNPQAFLQQEMRPIVDQMRAEMQLTREAMSADAAVSRFGEPQVTAARAALEQGMSQRDPAAWATYNRAMSSHDPYGVITRWHMDRETLQQIGGDLQSYREKLLSEALKDPAYQKRVVEAMRGSAPQVHQPGQVTQPRVPTLPSLSDIGQAGADEQQLTEPSDEALFRAAVSAKRRR